MKTYIDIKLRLRQDSGEIEPAYTEQQILSKLVDGTAKFSTNNNGTIFIEDTEMSNKIMAVIENKKIEKNIPATEQKLREYVRKIVKDIIKEFKG